jgi:urea transport system permease protein
MGKYLLRLVVFALMANPNANAAPEVKATQTVAGDAADKEARELMAKAIISTGVEQATLIHKLAETGSDFVRETLVQWRQGDVFLDKKADGTVVPFVRDNGNAIAIATGDSLVTNSTEAAETTSKLRKAMKVALDLLSLAAPDPQIRNSAVMKLGMEQKQEYIPLFQGRLLKEKNSMVIKALNEGIAIIHLADADTAVRVAAVNELARRNSLSSIDLLKKLAYDPQPPVAKAATAALKSLKDYVFWVDIFGTIFRGLSLGSVLLVVALGLAITFGLMGVINMAHGEIMVVGAYATYMTQTFFSRHFGPVGQEWYFVVALPVSFLSAAAMGILLERGIIRFLYKRPLESLLATWGVSLVLQQVFRLVFGAANVQVSSPSWLSGNFTINDVIFGWNRLFVIGFAILIVFCTWLLLSKTPLGLLIRAVMQNREMAACMGVRTERVNMLTFAFGSGLAGLAGAFLSQIGNVGPGLGQNYIVDCFMTVVVGGVGSIVGTVWSAFGIGVADQTLQQILLNPVLGKITVLGAIILFLQWKPGGLFPTRSRSLES